MINCNPVDNKSLPFCGTSILLFYFKFAAPLAKPVNPVLAISVLLKLTDVREVFELPNEASVCRELILVKVFASEKDRQAIIAIADIFRAKIVDVSKESLIMELTGNQIKLNAFTELLDGFKITEIARTGLTGLARGTANLNK